MSNFASLGVSGAAVVLGVINSRSILELTKDAEEMKATITPEEPVSILTEAASGSDDEKNGVEDNIKLLEDSVLSMENTKDDLNTLTIGNNTLSTNSLRVGVEVNDLLLDIDNLVELSPDILDLLDKWTLFKQRVYMGANDEVLQINQCNIGLQKNRSSESAIHFNDIDDHNFSMFMSNTPGYSTSMGNIDALRIRVGEKEDEGFVVESMGEESIPRGVFSVSSKDGSTTMGSASIKDYSVDYMGFSHATQRSGPNGYAVSQTSDGLTTLNSRMRKNLQLCIKGEPKMWLGADSDLNMSIKNNDGVSDTRFGRNGDNVIVSRNGASTRFRNGESEVDNMTIGDRGVRVNGNLLVAGVDIKETISDLYSRLEGIKESLAQQYRSDMHKLANPEITDGYISAEHGPPVPLFESPPGMYSMVRIYNNPDREPLSLGEVEIFDERNSNVARDPTRVYDVWQTNTFGDRGASLAVNGVTHGNYNNNGVTHTLSGNGLFWRISFKIPIQITSIRIYNRTDLHFSRLHDCPLQLLANEEVVETRNLVGLPASQTFHFFSDETVPEQVFLPIPPPPPSIVSGNKISLQSMNDGDFIDVFGKSRVDEADSYRLNSWGSNGTSTDRKYWIETLDGSSAIKNLTDVTFRNNRYNTTSYVKWAHHNRVEATGTDRTANEVKFRIHSDTTYVNSGDVVAIYSYGGDNYMSANGRNMTTVGGGLDNPKSLYRIEIR